MKKNDYDREVFRSFAMISQFGINMIVPILLCGALGLFLDRRLGTSFIAIIMFFVGALAGFRNIFVFAKKTYSAPGQTRRDRERARRRSAGEQPDEHSEKSSEKE